MGNFEIKPDLYSPYGKKIDQNLVPDREMAYFLAKRSKVEYVYNVIHLEGNPMTYPEVQTLLEGITVGGHKISDERQVLNQNKAVECLFELVRSGKFEMSKEVFCRLNHLVAMEESIEWGVFRRGQVAIGGTDYMPPQAKELDDIFSMGLERIKEIRHPAIMAFVFFGFGCHNQFFWDGNKRTSRLMANGILMQNGYPILNIKAKDALAFNKTMVDFYNGGDYRILLDWIVDYYIETNRYFWREKEKK